MILFENETAAVRRFTADDWSDVLEMVQTNQAPYFDGREGTFTGCELTVTREDYEKHCTR